MISRTIKRYFSNKKVVVTAALNGILTDPSKFNIPVSPSELAIAASEAYDSGASVVHIHFRDQKPGKGHLPTWEPQVAKDISDAIRAARPKIIVNFTTGTVGESGSMGGKEKPRETIILLIIKQYNIS